MKKVTLFLLIIAILFGFVITSHAASVKKIEAYIKTLKIKIVIARKRKNFKRVKKLLSLLKDAEIALTQKIDKDANKDKVEPVWLDKDKIKEVEDEKDLNIYRKELRRGMARVDKKLEAIKDRADRGATVHGRAYVYWKKELGVSKSAPNQFDIGRVYLDYKNKLGKNADVRLTTDISRTADNYNLYLKYAYFGLNDFGFPHISNIRIGQSPTHWIDLMQKYWKYRYVAKTLTDHYGFFNSADLGVAVIGDLDSSLNISYHLTVMNGEGYKKAETNPQKDIGLTVKLDPIVWDKYNKITTAFGAYLENYDFRKVSLSGLTKKTSAMITYQFSAPRDGVVFVEYANQYRSINDGFSFGGQYSIIDNANIFGRIDSFKKASDDYALSIVGLEYVYNKYVKLALDFQNETKNKIDQSRMVALHSQVKW